MQSPAEEVKSRLDVIEVIQGYTRLHKAGINYKAVCPFHHEKTPSFFVSPARQIWHCFGCGKGGDMFRFVMEIEGFDFPEALRLLAGRAGVRLTREDPALQSERRRLHDACEAAAKLFEKTLAATPVALAYLKKRGLTDETIRGFRVGFAPDSWDYLLRSLGGTFATADLEAAGLVVRSDDKASRYDRFRGRIMFPITDAAGRVIAFGGRIFEIPGREKRNPERTEAKYVNTPQTLLYDKSRVLYGFDKAKQEIRVKNQVVLVEGYMDLTMSHQAGVKNAVAVSGTALTPPQLVMLKRLAETMVSSFDADAAGDSATRRSLALASEFGFDRRIAAIPSGKDPADTVLEDPAAWVRAVAEARPVVEFYFEKAFRENNPSSAEGKKAIAATVLPFMAELADEIERAHWVAKLAGRLGVPEEAVWKELRKRPGVAPAPSGRSAPGSAEADGGAPRPRRAVLEERMLMLLAAADGDLRQRLIGSWTPRFAAAPHGEIFAALAGSAPDAARHRETIETLKFKSEMMLATNNGTALEDEFSLTRRELDKEHLRSELERIGAEIKAAEAAANHAAVEPLLREFSEVSGQLKTIAG